MYSYPNSINNSCTSSKLSGNVDGLRIQVDEKGKKGVDGWEEHGPNGRIEWKWEGIGDEGW